MDFKYVYKICTSEEWEKAKKKGKYEGSKKDKEDGFIHFSDKEQLKETLNKFFFKQKNLILLKIDAFKLLIIPKSNSLEHAYIFFCRLT